jgi:hypothetical protein
MMLIELLNIERFPNKLFLLGRLVITKDFFHIGLFGYSANRWESILYFFSTSIGRKMSVGMLGYWNTFEITLGLFGKEWIVWSKRKEIEHASSSRTDRDNT